jgi:hypothetical protein
MASRSDAHRSAASSGCLVRTLIPRWRRWTRAGGGIGFSIASSGGRGPNLKELAHRVTIAPDFLANVRALITPGTTLVLTDTPVNARTRTARGFNILTD